MKIKEIVQIVWLTGALSVTSLALAYTDDKPEQFCKEPQFKGFNLPTYNATDKIEVLPEAELSFTVSGWTDPETIVVTAKNEPLELTIENKMIFYRIKAKLPATLAGKFVRVNARAKAVLGCKSETGWLLKVSTTEKAVEEAGDVTESVETKAKPLDQEGDVKAVD